MLTGTLVTLRRIEPDDYPVLAAWANDVEVELLSGGAPPTPTPLASATAVFERMREDPDSVNFGIVAKEVRTEPDALIGQCGLFRQDALARTAEVGIIIGDREYWGRGYGRDALNLLLDYGFRIRNLRRIWLSVHSSNARAIRAYAAVGFVEEGRLREQAWSAGGYVDLLQMGLLRREWTGPAGRTG